MKITFEPMLAEPGSIVLWSLFTIALFFCLLLFAGISALMVWLVKRQNKKNPLAEKPAHEKTAPIQPAPPNVPPTEIIRSHCPECGTPLSSGTLAGLCPACLLKTGAATDTLTEAKQSPFIPPEMAQLAAKFPQLEILELIGKGGMGAVYKVRQKQLDRIVALKILPPGIGDDPAFAERFAREAKALAKLNHPNIVTLYEFGNASGQFYFLMEFVDGVNLRQLLQASRISAREALAIVPQICDALQFAHDQGIVHRDIKPENILLDRRGRVKVADFGLAKIIGVKNEIDVGEKISVATNLTDAGKIMGTPDYMSPEQKENPGDVDHRADIYALGVVFYQMLTGELPGKRLEPPSKKVSIDVRLDEIVLRALEKKPELRFQSASVLKTQIETISNGSDQPKTVAPRAPVFNLTTWFFFCVAFIYSGTVLYELLACFWQGRVRIETRQFQIIFGIFTIGAFLLTVWLKEIARSQTQKIWLKATAGLALISSLPFITLALGFVWAMRRDRNPWRLDFRDLGIFIIVWLGAIILPIASYKLWRATGQRTSSADSQPRPKPDHFWRRFALAMLVIGTVVLVIFASRNFLSKKPNSNFGYNYDRQNSAPTQLVARVTHTLTGAPFSARLPGGGNVKLLAIQTPSATNGSWWQPDGSPSQYGPDITLEKGILPADGVRALVHLPMLADTGATNYTFPNGLHFALQDGQRMAIEDFGIIVFDQSLSPGQKATTLDLPFGLGAWQTLTTKKPRLFGNWFASAADKQWDFSETATGVLKITVDHLMKPWDTEFRFVAVDTDGNEHLPATVQTTHTGNNLYSKYEATFDGIGLTAPLPFKNFREIRLESRAYQHIDFSNVSLQPGQKTSVQVDDFSAAPTTNFFIGQTYFPKGDLIEITSVARTEDQLTVKGRYHLVSADEASLWLNITATNNDEVPNQTEPPQSLHISKGAGDFELSRSQLTPGLPHVSMYDQHHAFAGIYFGTKAEASAESKFDLNDYLAKTITLTRATNQLVGASNDLLTVTIWSETYLNSNEKLRAFVKLPDGRITDTQTILFTRWAENKTATSTGFTWNFKDGFEQTNADEAVAQLKKFTAGRPLELIAAKPFELFSVTNRQGGTMSGYLQFDQVDPQPPDAADKIKTMVRIRHRFDMVMTPMIAFSANVPSGYALRATANSGSANISTPAGPYGYLCSWMPPFNPGSNSFPKRFRPPTTDQTVDLPESFEVVLGQPKLLFSITNGPDDVFQGFLELVGPNNKTP